MTGQTEQPVPEHPAPVKQATITPYLAVHGAAAAIEFYKRALGAVEIYRITDPDGRIGHAELKIDGATVFISDEYPEINVFGPQRAGGSPVLIVLEVADAGARFEQAVQAGAWIDRPMQSSMDGTMRNGKLIDPFGHRWMILTRSP